MYVTGTAVLTPRAAHPISFLAFLMYVSNVTKDPLCLAARSRVGLLLSNTTCNVRNIAILCNTAIVKRIVGRG